MVYRNLSLAYDIIVNFIDAHEEANQQITKIIENQHFVSQILNESKKDIQQAEVYIMEHIEDMFPEIAKAIQMRRAQYFLLNDGYSFIQSMITKGQIEDKDGQKLKNEIDNMIVSLDNTLPDINLVFFG